jgi:hypothetical protein
MKATSPSIFWPCAVCSLYRSDRGWIVSSLWPFRRALFTKPQMIEAWRDGKKEKREMHRINEKIHWSVIERLGRDAIVDGSISKMYAPDNLPKKWVSPRWSEANRPAVEKDPRVAQETPTEARLIALCRAAHSNERIQSCALFCKLTGKDTPASWLSIDAIRAYFSPQEKRARRLRRLRKIWDMENAKEDLMTTSR